MKKNLLFITPNLKLGGTNSALIALIEILVLYNYNIQVYALDNFSPDKLIQKELDRFLLPNSKILSGYHANYKELKTKDKIWVVWIKFIKTISKKLSLNVEDLLSKRVLRRLEKKYLFHAVIGYQEASATLFSSTFKNNNKIAWVHCDYNRHLPIGKTEEHIYRKFRKIVMVSKFTKDVFDNRYPNLKYKTEYFHNIFNVDKIKILSQEKIEDSDFSNDLFTIISIGRLSPVKRYSYIPSIAKDLKARGHNFKWYIIGPASDSVEQQKISSNIQKNNVSDSVFMLGAKSNPYPYFTKSNLLVSLSESEACPMIFNEAKILSLPIISADFGSSYEFIENGVDGLITPIEKMCDTIEKVILDKKLYSSIKKEVSKFKVDYNSEVKRFKNIVNP